MGTTHKQEKGEEARQHNHILPAFTHMEEQSKLLVVTICKIEEQSLQVDEININTSTTEETPLGQDLRRKRKKYLTLRRLSPSTIKLIEETIEIDLT